MYPSLGTPNLEQSCFRLQNPPLHKFLRTPLYIYMLARLQNTDEKEKADNDDERETKTRETHKAKSVALRESRIWGEC